MTYYVTEEQREKIELAIAYADGPGETLYAAGCVVAQLAKLEGVSRRRLIAWDRRDEYGIEFLRSQGMVRELAPYPVELLQALQRDWDNADWELPIADSRAALLSRFHELIGATTDA